MSDLGMQGSENAISSVHPMIGSLIGEKRQEKIELGIDDPENILRLEVEHWSIDYIREWYAQPDLTSLEQSLAPLYSPMHTVDVINNQFAAKILPCFLNPDEDEALSQFRQITHNTIDEEMVLLVNDEQFLELQSGLLAYLRENSEKIQKEVEANIERIASADRYQFSGTVTRNLEHMRREGSEIVIDPRSADKIRAAGEIAGEGILPITEYLKNDRILGVSGFMGSKISLAVHDNMDHVWTFDMLEKAGLIEKYSEMFDSIGNPEATDMFKREGEVVASVAYGVRYYYSMPPGFGPIFRSSQMEDRMDELFIARGLERRHMDAYRTIKEYRRGSLEWQSLGFAFSNYVTELEEQRRKFGTIKQRDPMTKTVVGEFDPFSPDFISFFIETHGQILNPKNKHRDDLFRFHILLEEYLSSFAKGLVPEDQPLTITIGQLRDIDFRQTTLPPSRIKWMFKNPGFTATKGAII